MSFWSRDPILFDAIIFDPCYFYSDAHQLFYPFPTEVYFQFDPEIVILSNVTCSHRAKCQVVKTVNMGCSLAMIDLPPQPAPL